jgi:hypothetical protein
MNYPGRLSDGPTQRDLRMLGDRLMEAGLITRTELEFALGHQTGGASRRRRVGRILVDLGFISDRELTKMLSVQFAMPVAPFDLMEAEDVAVRTLPVDFARLHRLLPYRFFSGSLLVAATEPVDTAVMNKMRRFTRNPVLIYLASDIEVEAALERHYGLEAAATAGASAPAEPLTRAAEGEEGSDMPTTSLQEIRERAQRYAAQTRELGDNLLQLADENERLTLELQASEDECRKLRDETYRLREELDRSRQQRDDILTALTRFTQDTVGR